MAFPTEDEMRARFWELKREVDAIEAESKPHRDKYDAAVQAFHAKIEPLKKKVKEVEAPLFDKKNEMGQIVRALNGRTAIPGEHN